MAEGVGSALHKLPWWALPLGGGAVGLMILLSRRAGKTAAPADLAATAPADTFATGGAADTLSQAIQGLRQQEQSDIGAIQTQRATDVTQLQSAIDTGLQQQTASQQTLAQSFADNLAQATAALSAQIAALHVTSDVTQETVGAAASGKAPTGSKNKHHIDANDKAKHERRQEKKGQVGHK